MSQYSPHKDKMPEVDEIILNDNLQFVSLGWPGRARWVGWVGEGDLVGWVVSLGWLVGLVVSFPHPTDPESLPRLLLVACQKLLRQTFSSLIESFLLYCISAGSMSLVYKMANKMVYTIYSAEIDTTIIDRHSY